MEAAIDWLRKKGLSKAAKKAGRVAAEGLVGVAVDGTRGAAGRGQCRDRFRRPQRAVPGLRRRRRQARARGRRRSEKLLAAPMPATARRVAETLTAADRHDRREHDAAPHGHAVGRAGRGRGLRPQRRRRPSLGKIGVLVALEVDRRHRQARGASASSSPCMSPPPPRCRSTSSDRRSGRGRARARRPDRAGHAASGKPDDDHREDGRRPHAQVLRGSRAAEAGLRHRRRDPGRQACVEKAAKEVGAPITVDGFVRFALGEGIEKEPKRLRRRGRGAARRAEAGIAAERGRGRAPIAAELIELGGSGRMPTAAPDDGRPPYRRVLLKVSGEALMGDGEFGIDTGHRRPHRRRRARRPSTPAPRSAW